ncbi:putative membrane protein [Catenuloplanes nepalensis]|uniref:Membrane protein n=1 Tax=Catenuloplanes nepalensis TaxID=587533 RepID=A0ABT9MRF9_9ACTN|nr:hypothetical protein [Catenuloplanes nepalensis]MDP9794021.1 putative membrane protein [Catenuloplanes nepalensis]
MLLVRSFLLGVVSGGRSMSGLAAVALTSRSGPLARPWTRALTAAGALGELAGDKLPNAPSRLQPPALAVRAATGAAAAAALAARAHAAPALHAIPGAAGAILGSVAGARWRSYADRRGWPPLAAALLEDAVVIALAAAISHRR